MSALTSQGNVSPSGDNHLPQPKNLRVGFYIDDGFFQPAKAVQRAVEEAAAALSQDGAEIIEFRPPGLEEALRIYFTLFLADGMMWMRQKLKDSKADWRLRRLLLAAQVPSALRPVLKWLNELLGQRYLAKMSGWCANSKPRVAEYWRLVEQQSEYRRRFLQEFNKRSLDVIVCPPNALSALRHGTFYGNFTGTYAVLYNLLGLPAGVIPVTRVKEDEENPRKSNRDLVLHAAAVVECGSVGLPIGVQVVAAPGREDTVLAVMAALEEGLERNSRPLTRSIGASEKSRTIAPESEGLLRRYV